MNPLFRPFRLGLNATYKRGFSIMTMSIPETAAPTTIKVKVKYAAAAKPFLDEAVVQTETLGALKTRVLTAFELTEGGLPDGTNASYKLYHGKDELTDLGATVGSFAHNAHALDLKMSQFITQGTL
jgi:hypothetical protein